MGNENESGKPTPGPWAKAETRTEGFVITSRTDLVVHSVDEYGHYGPIKSSANADLIAAAPDLLEALEHLLLYSNQGTLHPVAAHNARKAIARARGLSQ